MVVPFFSNRTASIVMVLRPSEMFKPHFDTQKFPDPSVSSRLTASPLYVLIVDMSAPHFSSNLKLEVPKKHDQRGWNKNKSIFTGYLARAQFNFVMCFQPFSLDVGPIGWDGIITRLAAYQLARGRWSSLPMVACASASCLDMTLWRTQGNLDFHSEFN